MNFTDVYDFIRTLTDRSEVWHDKRYAEIACMLHMQGMKDGQRILEIGDHGTFTKVLNHYWPNSFVFESEHDLRDPCYEPPWDMDWVLCMEVIEHVGEPVWCEECEGSASGCRKDDHKADWLYRGAKNLLQYIKNSLGEGGTCLMTTPNVSSVRSVFNCINFKPIHSYGKHTHEYSSQELHDLVTEAGFTVTELLTMNSWNDHGMPQQMRKDLRKFLLRYNRTDSNLRDDNIVMLFK